MVEAYPLCWPVDYPKAKERKNSRFTGTLAQVRDDVKKEVDRIHGRDLIISTNIPVNSNGDLRADWSRYRLDDPGVAVYFMYKGNQVCLCCDTYLKVWENLRAVARTIEALRQIERDGVSDFLNRAFTGFKAIPQYATPDDIWSVLGIEPTKDQQAISSAYRSLTRTLHPNAGGSREGWDKLQLAYDSAIKQAMQ